MGFDAVRAWPWVNPILQFPESWEYLILAVYLMLSAVILVHHRRGFTELHSPQLLLLAVLLVSPLVTNTVLGVVFSPPNLLSPSNVAGADRSLFTPLLGMLPVMLAAAWLGAGPAYIVGLSCGIVDAFPEAE